MHLLPPFVTTHHQNVAFFVLLLIIVLVQQSISGAPLDDLPQSSSDQSSSDEERRRPMQPRAITRSTLARPRSGPLFLGRPVKMNYTNDPEKMPSLSFNNSRPPSLENTIKAFEDEKNMKKLDEKRIKIQELLCDDLKQIQKNIRRSKQPFFKRLLHFKVKSNEKKQAKNAELRDKFLNYIPEEDACKQLLPTWDPITGKTYKDYELRMEAGRKLDLLTGWIAVKAAFSTMENSARLSCSTIYEDADDDGNGIDRLSNPKSSPRDKSKSKTEKLKQFFKFNKKKEKINDYLPSPKGNNDCFEQRSISFRDAEYENRQMHKGLIEPRHSLDIASERIASRKSVDLSQKNVDISQTLQQNSIQRSTKANNFGFDFGFDNALTRPNFLQRSTSTRPIDNGTLPSLQRFITSARPIDNGTLPSLQRSTSARPIDNGTLPSLQRSTSAQPIDNGTLPSLQPSTSTRLIDNGTLSSLQRSTSARPIDFTSARPIDNGTLPQNSMQRFTSSKSTDFGFSKSKMSKNFVEGRRSVDNHIELNSSYAEIGDESKNLPCVLQRSYSTRKNGRARSLSVGAELFDLKADEQCIFKEGPIKYTVQWDVLQTGMLCMRDTILKKSILAMCRRVNYELQLLILQSLLLKTKPKHDSNESSREKREQELIIRENMLEYKQNFIDKKDALLNFLNDRISNGQLGEEFNKALVELRDKVVVHWAWLYEQHRR